MAKKTIDSLLKSNLPDDYILNVSNTKENISINVSSLADSKEKFDVGITINGNQAAAAKALELINEIVSESI